MSIHLNSNSIATPVAVCLFAFLTATESPAQSAPEEIPGWGRFEDPSGQAKVELAESRLTITSGKNEMRARSLGRMPRIIREVEGDFDVQVRVQGEFTQEYQEGVLLAWTSPEEYFALSSGSGRYRSKQVHTTVMTRGVITGGRHHRRKSASNWIRIRRIGDELTSYYSDDGRNWMRSRQTSDIRFKDGTGPTFKEPMKVMLLVHNRAQTPLDVHFEHFRFRQDEGIEPVQVVEDAEELKNRQRTMEAMAAYQKIFPDLKKAYERGLAVISVSRPAAVETLRSMRAQVAIRREGGIFSFGVPTGISWVEFEQTRFNATELEKVIFALSRLGVADIRIGLGASTLDDAQRKRLMHEVPGKTSLHSRLGYFDGPPQPNAPLPDVEGLENDPAAVRVLLEAGLKSETWPANVALRLESDLWKAGAKSTDRLKETWEFSNDRVHKVLSDLPLMKGPGEFQPRVFESRPFNTDSLCKQLLDGQIPDISERKGSGKPALFVGTNFDVGDRAIMVLVDGKPVLDVRESCLFTGFPETDARAFAEVYEQLASQARREFQAKKEQAPQSN